MNHRLSTPRLRGALAVSLALTGLAAVSPAVFGAPPNCSAQTPGCTFVVAQAADTAMQPMPQAMPAMPGQPSERGRSRGVFLAMFAQAVVPGLVSGIDAWLRNKLNVPMQGGPADTMQAGQMANGYRPQDQPAMQPMQPMQGMQGLPQQPGAAGWSQPGPMPMPMAQGPMQGQMISNSFAPQMAQPMGANMPSMQGQPPVAPPPGMADEGMALQAGVAYQVSLVGRDGGRTLVDPAQRAFGTGERIMLAYRTNLPGLVEVYNIDSTGREELIDQQQMGAGQLANLGPYEFVNVKGEETLRILLRPCVGGDASTGTRGMVRAQVNPELGNRLLGCEDPSLRQQRSGTRGIAKVQVEDGTSFALDPLSRSEIESGRLEPREVRVRFMHR